VYIIIIIIRTQEKYYFCFARVSLEELATYNETHLIRDLGTKLNHK
jgi:hypothetical protein